MFNTKFKIVSVALIALMAVTATSCTDDLNTSPIDDDVETSESVYTGPDKYRQVLAKLYAGFATTGQQGPAGDPDIQGIDEGFSSYLRQLWVAQEIPTDEAVVGWNDPGLPSYNYQGWTASNDFVMGLYSRIYYQISLANEFIRNAKGNDNQQVQQYLAEARFLRALSYWHALDMFGGGVPFVTEDDPVGAFQPEPIGAQELFNFIESELKAVVGDGENPATQLLPDPQQNDYGRADKAAAWTVLSKLYLNAEVYIDEARYDDAVTYANNVIDQGGYTLESDYGNLFRADNHEANGVIFAIPFDGVNTQTFGGTTFIAHAAVGGSMNIQNFGLDAAWAGHRVTPQFADKLDNGDRFNGYMTENPDGDDEIYIPGGYQSGSGYTNDWSPADAPPLVSDNNDDIYTGYFYVNSAGVEFKFKANQDPNDWTENWGDNEGDGTLELGGDNLVAQKPGLHKVTVNLNDLTYEVEIANKQNSLYTDGQEKEIPSVKELAEFTNGYALSKWKNITKNGQTGSDLTFVDIDFPMFRLADVYLMYAEATLRGNSGDENKALTLVNDLRERSYGSDIANISSSELTLDFILDERARELHWEAHRRTDLRRFGQYTGDDYVWAMERQGSKQEPEPMKNTEIFPIPCFGCEL
ncbi:RagB/SusD family nutrient uptake outer membrane protein [Fodinibius sp.]|uniref:RagB/SusD family nutrient uptake outer membrane protein n=1 Tax=Fodinibius sp. TaxID=1872440 RepID=UPI002ACD6F0B|nr:RagB/SusD family nutrient uptake outer membrane protein [Fodinibius sp.]MDZ7660092.1 RagB/SusD family nutrient uptake outer membrane protein [Fodinibius sp.]